MVTSLVRGKHKRCGDIGISLCKIGSLSPGLERVQMLAIRA